MRSAIAILMIPFLAVGLAIWSYSSSKKASRELSGHLERMIVHVQSSQWNEAQRDARQLAEAWRETQKTWGLVMDHSEIDALDACIVRTLRLVSLRERDDALAEAAVARRMAEHITEREVPGFGNVF